MRRLLNPLVGVGTLVIGLLLNGIFDVRWPGNLTLPQSRSVEIAVAPLPSYESERSAVLSALIGNMYVDSESKLLVIQDASRCEQVAEVARSSDELSTELENQTEDYAFVRMPALKRDTIADFRARAQECHPLGPGLDVPFKYVLVTAKDMESLFGNAEFGDGWSKFYRKYKGSTGILSFSNVGFDVDMKQALVTTGWSCGGLCGEGNLVFLTKENGVWKVQVSVGTWVS